MCIPLKPVFSRHKGDGVQITDEPTGNLDTAASHDVIGLLRLAAKQFQQTVVLITHDSDIAQTADRIVRIEDGRIVKRSGSGKKKDRWADEENPEEKGGACHVEE